MENEMNIDRFLDAEGRLRQLPRKYTVKRAALEYLAGKFEPGRDYTEREVNALCDAWHSFGDFHLLRRELVDNRLLARERDGSRYWRPAQEEPAAGRE